MGCSPSKEKKDSSNNTSGNQLNNRDRQQQQQNQKQKQKNSRQQQQQQVNPSSDTTMSSVPSSNQPLPQNIPQNNSRTTRNTTQQTNDQQQQNQNHQQPVDEESEEKKAETARILQDQLRLFEQFKNITPDPIKGALLDNIPLLFNINQLYKDKIAALMKEEKFSNGDVVFSCGDKIDYSSKFYLILSGKFNLYLPDDSIEYDEDGSLHQLSQHEQRQAIPTIENGDYFGESSLLFNIPRGGTVSCQSERGGVVLTLKKGDFLTIQTVLSLEFPDRFSSAKDGAINNNNNTQQQKQNSQQHNNHPSKNIEPSISKQQQVDGQQQQQQQQQLTNTNRNPNLSLTDGNFANDTRNYELLSTTNNPTLNTTTHHNNNNSITCNSTRNHHHNNSITQNNGDHLQTPQHFIATNSVAGVGGQLDGNEILSPTAYRNNLLQEQLKLNQQYMLRKNDAAVNSNNNNNFNQQHTHNNNNNTSLNTKDLDVQQQQQQPLYHTVEDPRTNLKYQQLNIKHPQFQHVDQYQVISNIMIDPTATLDQSSNLIDDNYIDGNIQQQNVQQQQQKQHVSFTQKLRNVFFNQMSKNSLLSGLSTQCITQIVDNLTRFEIPLLPDVDKDIHLQEEQVLEKVIIKQNEVGQHLFIIESGYVDVYVNDSFVNQLGPGAIFGELALLNRAKRNATIKTSIAHLQQSSNHHHDDQPQRGSLSQHQRGSGHVTPKSSTHSNGHNNQPKNTIQNKNKNKLILWTINANLFRAIAQYNYQYNQNLIKNVINQHILFNTLTTLERNAIVNNVELLTIEKNNIIFKQDDIAVDGIYILLSGAVGVYRYDDKIEHAGGDVESVVDDDENKKEKGKLKVLTQYQQVGDFFGDFSYQTLLKHAQHRNLRTLEQEQLHVVQPIQVTTPEIDDIINDGNNTSQKLSQICEEPSPTTVIGTIPNQQQQQQQSPEQYALAASENIFDEQLPQPTIDVTAAAEQEEQEQQQRVNNALAQFASLQSPNNLMKQNNNINNEKQAQYKNVLASLLQVDLQQVFAKYKVNNTYETTPTSSSAENKSKTQNNQLFDENDFDNGQDDIDVHHQQQQIQQQQQQTTTMLLSPNNRIRPKNLASVMTSPVKSDNQQHDEILNTILNNIQHKTHHNNQNTTPQYNDEEENQLRKEEKDNHYSSLQKQKQEGKDEKDANKEIVDNQLDIYLSQYHPHLNTTWYIQDRKLHQLYYSNLIDYYHEVEELLQINNNNNNKSEIKNNVDQKNKSDVDQKNNQKNNTDVLHDKRYATAITQDDCILLRIKVIDILSLLPVVRDKIHKYQQKYQPLEVLENNNNSNNNNINTLSNPYGLSYHQLQQQYELMTATGGAQYNQPLIQINQNNTTTSSDNNNITKSIQQQQQRRMSITSQPLLTNFKNLRIIAVLGAGAFGTTFLVKDIITNKTFAMKSIRKEKIHQSKQQQHLLNEVFILSKLTYHPFIIQLYATARTPTMCHLIFQAALGGDLLGLLRKYKMFTENQARFYIGCVCLALSYMHSKNIIYRDLKPENIAILTNGVAKLIDMGFAKELSVPLNAGGRTNSICFTLDYLSPEMLKKEYYNHSVDIYAVGILLYELVAGYTPWYSLCNDQHLIYQAILNPQFEIKFPSYFSKELKDLLYSLLQRDVTSRLGCYGTGCGLYDVMEHPWFNIYEKDYQNILLLEQQREKEREQKEKEQKQQNSNDDDDDNGLGLKVVGGNGNDGNDNINNENNNNIDENNNNNFKYNANQIFHWELLKTFQLRPPFDIPTKLVLKKAPKDLQAICRNPANQHKIDQLIQLDERYGFDKAFGTLLTRNYDYPLLYGDNDWEGF